ncbi:response regulator [Paramagnetospirillum kuznetsovii]|uniref:response regulator n=1 Tax=Paramagnetospirillum kuznetsovii TaxID=2053833 RepID=UPI001374E0DD|nr:response regulator [Paramagnetospirillum kuznetsovii]
MARIADESVSGRLHLVDLLLQDMDVEARSADTAAEVENLLAQMKGRTASLPGLRNLSISDHAGRMIYSTLPELIGFDASKRPYFIGHQTNQDSRRLHINGPILASTGQVLLFASRSKETIDGKWDGVTVAALQPEYFAETLRSIQPQPDGIATLISYDGTIIARSPRHEEFSGRNIGKAPATMAHRQSGERVSRSKVVTTTDHVSRLIVNRTMDFPELVLAVGWGEDEVLVEWRRTALIKGAILSLLALGAALVLLRFSRHEQELQRSQRFISGIADAMPGMVAYWGQDLRCRFANKPYLEWFGKAPSAILGKTMLDLMGERLFAMNEPYIRGAQAGQRQQFERTLTKANGEIGYTWAHYIPDVATDGTVSGFFVLVTDITPLKAAELKARDLSKRLGLATKAGGIGVWEYDLAGGGLIWDDRMHEIYGLPRSEENPNYEHWRSAIHPADLEVAEFGMAAAIRGDKDFDTEFRILRADGEIRHIHAAAMVERDEGGTAKTMIGVNWDVTNIRRNEKALVAATGEAERANRAKSEFLANMSHEIRTPLNAILGLTHLMERGDLTAEQRDFAAKIRQSGRSLLSIINDILDFSKVEAGRLELEKADFRLADLLDAIATIMTVNAGTKDLELLIHRAPDVANDFCGDSLRLQQVLINLIGNAIKFTESGEVVLRIELESTRDRTVTLRFTVADTGIGIPRDKLDNLFDAFSQADSSTTRRYGGSGLGLAICKRLVELMGGRIGVASEIGRGSTFWFTVPLETAKPVPVAASLQHLEVLIADDHDVARTVIAETAQSLGWRPDVVGSGQDAVMKAQDRLRDADPFDVLILDWKMPDMDGLAVTRALRDSSGLASSPIVVMVTAGNREDLLHSPGAELVDAILVKPITGSSLFNAVSDARARRLDGGTTNMITPLTPGEGPRLMGLRILVVEDNAINQDVARRVLELEGASVTLASDGQEAVDRLARTPNAFEIVLMDIQMPGLDGYEATARIRQDLGLSDLPILALSAGALSAERRRAQVAGMNDFIAKPFDPDLMIACILRYANPPPAGDVKSGAPKAVDISGFPDIPGIDTHQASLRLGSDGGLFRSLLNRVVEQFADEATRIRADLASGDDEAAARRLHTLRGALGNVAAIRAAKLASETEAAVKDGKTSRISPLLDDLERSLGGLVAAIGQALSAPPPQGAASAAPATRSDMEQLTSILEQRSMAALDLFDRLRPGLDASLAATLAPLVEKLKFDDAAAWLKQWLGTKDNA